MKRQYSTPIARRVSFNYEKVVAASPIKCYWGSYYEGRYCHETYQESKGGIMLASIPDCGWVQEKEE